MSAVQRDKFKNSLCLNKDSAAQTKSHWLSGDSKNYAVTVAECKNRTGRLLQAGAGAGAAVVCTGTILGTA